MVDPLTPPECDLRGLPFMPMDVVRVLDSDLFALSTGEEFKAALALWCKAWLQVPAASLPDDDRVLAHLSGAGARWKKIKAMALKGWIKCDDGRLYHPVIAEKAVDAWERRSDWNEKQGNKNERQQRWRDHVKRVSAELRELGITPPMNASLKELERLLVDANASPRASTSASTVDEAETALTGTGTGTVEGKHQAQPPNLNSNLEPTREKPPEGIADAATAFNYVCREADWRPANDTQRQNGIGILAGWLALGCTLELILEGIGRARKRDPSATRSLKRFDSTIRGMRRDQVGELPVSPSDVRAVTDGVAKRLAVN